MFQRVLELMCDQGSLHHAQDKAVGSAKTGQAPAAGDFGGKEGARGEYAAPISVGARECCAIKDLWERKREDSSLMASLSKPASWLLALPL